MKRSSPNVVDEQPNLLPDKRSRVQVNVIAESEVEIDESNGMLGGVETVIDDEEAQQVIQIQDTSGNIVTEEILGIEGTSSEDGTSIGVLAQHMDITEPLSTLRTLLEQRLGVSLEDFTFYLQDTQELDATKNLVDQCVQGEGLIQVNVEIVERDGIKKINIVDVLKPAEELLTLSPEMVQQVNSEQIGEPQVVRKVVIPVTEEQERLTRWMVSPEFRLIQEKLKIPADPLRWSTDHVRHWIEWATQHFGLQNINLNDWNITGKELCELAHPDFVKKVPFDPEDLFWTHLELLRKCKIVAVIQQAAVVQQVPQVYSTVSKNAVIKNRPRVPKIGAPRVAYEGCPGNRTGNNGQIQLWQFLLELLTDKDHREYIQWIGEDGEFRLNNPEMVAQLWGQRKNKPSMNYEKLSRALRYYYDGDMISKVHGKRFVYKFVCDLKSLVGYDAAELNRLVIECEQKKIERLQGNVMTMSTLEITSSSPQNCEES